MAKLSTVSSGKHDSSECVAVIIITTDLGVITGLRGERSSVHITDSKNNNNNYQDGDD
jgi:hypothetical protein